MSWRFLLLVAVSVGGCDFPSKESGASSDAGRSEEGPVTTGEPRPHGGLRPSLDAASPSPRPSGTVGVDGPPSLATTPVATPGSGDDAPAEPGAPALGGTEPACEGGVPAGTLESRMRSAYPSRVGERSCRWETQTRVCREGEWSAWTGTFAYEACDDAPLTLRREDGLLEIARCAGRLSQESDWLAFEVPSAQVHVTSFSASFDFGSLRVAPFRRPLARFGELASDTYPHCFRATRPLSEGREGLPIDVCLSGRVDASGPRGDVFLHMGGFRVTREDCILSNVHLLPRLVVSEFDGVR